MGFHVVMSYKKQLIAAIERTRDNGIAVKDFVIESASYPIVNAQNEMMLLESFNEHVYNKPFEEIHGQCVLHSWNLQDIVADILNCDVLLTLGYLLNELDKYFFTEEQQILQWKEMPSNLRRDIHAWLTLPSLEIIDITLPATLVKMNKSALDYRTFMHYRPDDHYGLTGRIYHTPQFVDNDFLERVYLLKKLE